MRYGEPEAGRGVVRNRLFQPVATPCEGGHGPLLGLNVAVTTRTERKPEWRILRGLAKGGCAQQDAALSQVRLVMRA